MPKISEFTTDCINILLMLSMHGFFYACEFSKADYSNVVSCFLDLTGIQNLATTQTTRE